MSAQPSLRVVDSSDEKQEIGQPTADTASKPKTDQPAAQTDALAENVVARTVKDMCKHMAISHEIREDLVARGVPFHTLNMLIETGQRDHQNEQADLIEKTAVMSQKDAGNRGLTVQELQESVEKLVTIERDLNLCRHIAVQHEVNMPALNCLIQLIRLNPGDGGQAAINSFVGYAVSSGVELERFRDIASDIIKEAGESKSVLPQIAREAENEKRFDWRPMARDAVIGLGIAIIVMWMVL